MAEAVGVAEPYLDGSIKSINRGIMTSVFVIMTMLAQIDNLRDIKERLEKTKEKRKN